MAGTVLAAVLCALGAGLVTALGLRATLRRLPVAAPTDDEPSPGESPPRYGELATPRFVAVTAVAAALGAGAAGLLAPAGLLPTWLVLSTIGVWAVAVDAATTWIPRQLTWAGWAGLALTVPLTAALAGLGAALRAAAGALVVGAVFWLIWRVTRAGIGFGDVRLAPLLGAPVAALGWPSLSVLLVAGTVAGAVWGVARHLARRPGPFCYAPPLALGAWVALTAWALQ